MNQIQLKISLVRDIHAQFFLPLQKVASWRPEEELTLREQPPVAAVGKAGSRIGGWAETGRRPEDGKLINSLNGTLGSGLLMEDASSQIISPFSLFNLVQFPNTECTTDTG